MLYFQKARGSRISISHSEQSTGQLSETREDFNLADLILEFVFFLLSILKVKIS